MSDDVSKSTELNNEEGINTKLLDEVIKENSSNFNKIYESQNVYNNLEIEDNFIQTRNTDKSLDLLNFDVSMVEGYSNEALHTSTNESDYDTLQNDFLATLNNSSEQDYVSNISEILNETVEEHDNVATDNLIGLSPVKQLIDEGILDRLKIYHNKERQKWSFKELEYQNMIDNLKREHDNKVNALLYENEEKLRRMKSSNLKELRAQHLENEETLETMTSRHNEIFTSNKSERAEMLKDCNAIRNALVAEDADRVLRMITCNQKQGSIKELISTNSSNVNNSDQDNKVMESWFLRNVQKFEKSQDTIIALETNKKAILAAIGDYKLLIGEVTAKVQDNEKIIIDTKENCVQECRDIKSLYEKKGKRLEINAKHLEEVQANMKIELDLRVKEKEELTDILNSLL